MRTKVEKITCSDHSFWEHMCSNVKKQIILTQNQLFWNSLNTSLLPALLFNRTQTNFYHICMRQSYVCDCEEARCTEVFITTCLETVKQIDRFDTEFLEVQGKTVYAETLPSTWLSSRRKELQKSKWNLCRILTDLWRFSQHLFSHSLIWDRTLT